MIRLILPSFSPRSLCAAPAARAQPAAGRARSRRTRS